MEDTIEQAEIQSITLLLEQFKVDFPAFTPREQATSLQALAGAVPWLESEAHLDLARLFDVLATLLLQRDTMGAAHNIAVTLWAFAEATFCHAELFAWLAKEIVECSDLRGMHFLWYQ